MRSTALLVLLTILSTAVSSCGKPDELPKQIDVDSLQEFIAENPGSGHLDEANRMLVALLRDARAYPLLERRWIHGEDSTHAVLRAVDEAVLSAKPTKPLPFSWTTEVSSSEVRLQLFGSSGAKFDQAARAVEENLQAAPGIGDFSSPANPGWSRAALSEELSEVLVLDYDRATISHEFGNLIEKLESRPGILEVAARQPFSPLRYEVRIHPILTARYSIAATDIVTALVNDEEYLEKNPEAAPLSRDHLKQLVIASANGEVIRLDDVAHVRHIPEAQTASAYFDGRQALTYSVFRRKAASREERESLRRFIVSLLELPEEALQIIPCERVSTFEIRFPDALLGLDRHRDFDSGLKAGPPALSEWHGDRDIMRVMTPSSSLSLARRARGSRPDAEIAAIRFDESLRGRELEIVIEGALSRELLGLQDELIHRLDKIPSVVAFKGNRPASFREVHIEIDPRRCADMGVSEDEVETNVELVTKGVRTKSGQTLVRVGRASQVLETLNSVTVRNSNHAGTIELKKIADIRLREQSHLCSRDGVPCASVSLVIDPEASQLDVLEVVDHVVSELELPEGISVTIDKLDNR